MGKATRPRCGPNWTRAQGPLLARRSRTPRVGPGGTPATQWGLGRESGVRLRGARARSGAAPQTLATPAARRPLLPKDQARRGPGDKAEQALGRLLVAVGERRRPRTTGKPGTRVPGRREGLKQRPAQLGQEIQTWATQRGELRVAEGRSQCLRLSLGTPPALRPASRYQKPRPAPTATPPSLSLGLLGRRTQPSASRSPGVQGVSLLRFLPSTGTFRPAPPPEGSPFVF